MKNNLPPTNLLHMPGFRKVIPKEVFLMKQRQKKEERMMLVVPDEQVHVDAVVHLYGVMYALSCDAICAQQKILIATYFFPFFFFENVALLLRAAPVQSSKRTPHLRIVRAS